MPVQGTVSSAPALMKQLAWFIAVLVCTAGAFTIGQRFSNYTVLSARAPDGSRVALVTERTCLGGSCQLLWIGAADAGTSKVAELPAGARCTEIAWTRDSTRVAFVVDGSELRLFDAVTLRPAGRMTLVVQDARPTTRIARGVTFSDNGKAVTFDDCPRTHSGCRSGLAAVPQ
jgi:Tol biopolymer transport system component